MKRLLAVLVLVLGCDAQKFEAEAKAKTAREALAAGRGFLAQGQHEKAVAAFKAAMSAAPSDVTGYVLLADAYRLQGNDTGAILTLKQAGEVAGNSDPTIRRARADLYVKLHQAPNAITEFVALRDAELLTDSELLDLARLQAHSGKIDDAYKTLAVVQKHDTSQAESSTVEAELMLVKGDEVSAAQQMDKIIAANPTLTRARLLRARYFSANGHPDLAEKDLALISGDDARRIDVVTLRAKVLNELKRPDETAGILQPLVDENPRDAELLSLLAETRLAQGKLPEAQGLVDKALGLQPKYPSALTVRGHLAELSGNTKAAREDYEKALKVDASFVPARSRLWRLLASDEKVEALVHLERLLDSGDLTSEEKVALVGLSIDTGSGLDRAQKLADDLVKHDPDSAELKKLKARVQSKRLAGQKPQVIRTHTR